MQKELGKKLDFESIKVELKHILLGRFGQLR
jgi:hypothetical protein